MPKRLDQRKTKTTSAGPIISPNNRCEFAGLLSAWFSSFSFILYGNISFSFCFKHSFVVLTMTNQFATTELIQRQNGKVLPYQNDAF